MNDNIILNQFNSKSILYSLLTISPQILKGESFTNKTIIWSLGIIIYYILFKEYPFNGNTEYQIIKEIESKKLLNPIYDEELNDLVNKMLKINENERISWNDYLLHPFFKKNFETFNFPEFNYMCKNHYEPFELYCINCKLNICKLCKDNHNGHQMILFSNIGLTESELNQMENQIKIFDNNINNLNKIKTDVENVINKIKMINNNNSIYEDNLKDNYKEYYISCLKLINKQLKSIGNITFIKSYKFDYNNSDLIYKFTMKQDNEKSRMICKKLINNIEKNKNNTSPFKYLKQTKYDSELFIFEPSSISNSFIKRMKKELIEYFKNESYGIFIFSFIDNVLRGAIEGPPNTPYQNGIFFFSMHYPSDYPFKPPQFRFITKNIHPNIHLNGLVSIDIL